MAEEPKEFTPVTINNQEEMDALFKDRVYRLEKKYSGYVAPDAVEALKADYEKQLGDAKTALETAKNDTGMEELKTKLAELEKANADKDATIKGYELSKAKTAAALEAGLPVDLAERLSGETAEELRADAEKLAAVLNVNHSNNPAPPLRNPETPPAEDGVVAAFRKLNPNLKF